MSLHDILLTVTNNFYTKTIFSSGYSQNCCYVTKGLPLYEIEKHVMTISTYPPLHKVARRGDGPGRFNILFRETHLNNKE